MDTGEGGLLADCELEVAAKYLGDLDRVRAILPPSTPFSVAFPPSTSRYTAWAHGVRARGQGPRFRHCDGKAGHARTDGLDLP